MECPIFQDESFQEFLPDDFDIKSFSATVLQTRIVSDYLQHLNELVRNLDVEIKQQVSNNAPVLFRQATSIGTLEDVLENTQSRITSLKSTVNRISTKISEPYNKILARKYQLARLQNTCDLLRRIKGVMQQTKKLQSYMSSNATGQQQIELIKASQCLSELDHFTVDADFTGIEIVEKDLQFVFKARHDIQSQAQEVLDNGLHHLNPTQIGTALQVFYNLSTLDDRIKSVEERLKEDFCVQLVEFLDLKSLSKNKDPTNPGRATMPNIGNTPQFRALLWTNIEKVFNLIFHDVAQLTNLTRVLSKKRDPITHVTFLEQINKRGQKLDLIGPFWVEAMKLLRKQLKQTSTDSFHFRQALEGEYPKLLKLENDLINRLNQLDNGFGQLEMEPIDGVTKTQDQLNDTFEIFEKAFLSISLSRLSDQINLMFASNTNKTLPSQQELENFVKVMTNELTVGATTENLLGRIARNVEKSIQIFAAKCEQTICTDSEGSQVVTAPTAAQLRNIAAINILYQFSSMINKMLAEQANLSSFAIDRINNSLQLIHSLMHTAMHPFLNSVADCIEAILLTMHNEDFSQASQVRAESQTSLYMKELQEFILRIQKDYFNEFQCKDFMYENLVRPLGEFGIMRLAVDFAQIELALSPFCRRLTDLGKHYKILKAFRSLLILDSEVFLTNSSVGDVVPFDLVLHHLICRSPNELRSPHQVMNWSIGRYIQWLDEHPNQNDRLMMIKGTLDTYVQLVRTRQQKEFAPIYVIISSILEKALAANV